MFPSPEAYIQETQITAQRRVGDGGEEAWGGAQGQRTDKVAYMAYPKNSLMDGISSL